jgi:hypothetical protein
LIGADVSTDINAGKGASTTADNHVQLTFQAKQVRYIDIGCKAVRSLGRFRAYQQGHHLHRVEQLVLLPSKGGIMREIAFACLSFHLYFVPYFNPNDSRSTEYSNWW